jgi:hypothetical protein
LHVVCSLTFKLIGNRYQLSAYRPYVKCQLRMEVCQVVADKRCCFYRRWQANSKPMMTSLNILTCGYSCYLVTTVDHYEIGSVWPLFSSSRSPFTGSIMSVFDDYTLDDGQTDNWDDVCSLFTEITHPQCRRN